MKPVKEWKLVGFTNARKAHAHLLKHVLRVTQVDPAEETDPEQWEEHVASALLPPGLPERRAWALERARRTEGCAVAQHGVTGEDPCATCQDHRVQWIFDLEVKALMDSYLAAAAAVLTHAAQNPDRHGPRLIAYRDPSAGAGRVAFEAYGPSHVFVAGSVDVSGEARLHTCYRCPTRSYGSWQIEFGRSRANHRRAGTLMETR
jgi:hypothetical protein